jgi:hypothetical protein
MPRHIYLGTNAPNFAPTGIGHHYIDTVAKKPYTSVGTSSPADWSEGGGGGAPLSPDNPLPIGSTPSAGLSDEASAGDHVHEGVHSVAILGDTQLLGDVTLEAGTNVTFARTGNNISISASGGVESVGIDGDATALDGAVKIIPGSNIGLVRIGNGIEVSASAGRAWTTIAWSSTIVLNVASYGGFTVPISGATVIGAPLSPSADKSIMIRFRQDAVGGYAVSWSADWKFGAELYGISVATAPLAFTYVGAVYNSITSKWDVISWARGY